MKAIPKDTKGFTLIEMALVLVVIGMIVATILGGQSVMDSTKRNIIISDMRKHAQSYDNFREKYGTPPGDYSFQLIKTSETNPCSGDASGFINLPTRREERICSWYQLSQTAMIEGNFTGSTSSLYAGTDVPKLESAMPEGPYTNTYYLFDHYVTPTISGTSDRYGNIDALKLGVPVIQSVSGQYTPNAMYGFLTPEQAYRIDMKMDDGFPLQGKLSSSTDIYDSGGTAKCIRNYTRDGNFSNDLYDLESKDKACSLIYYMGVPYVQ